MLRNKDLMKNNKQITTAKEYQNLLKEIKGLLEKGLHEAYKVVDNLKVQTYWQIGERIAREELKNQDRADYGKFLINSLAVDLSIHKRDLYRCVKFYKTYPIVTTLSSQLSWWNYIELCQIDDEKERTFYQNKAIQNSWSVRKLRGEIRNNFFAKTSAKEIEQTLQSKLPSVQKAGVFKDVYDFNFIDDAATKKERDLEDQLLAKIELFLSELGNDISFLGRQVPIKIDNKTHFVDLALYHRGIPCVILVDLKIHKIDSGDIGQMNKYVSYYKLNRQYKHERDTIGLIICKDAGREEMRYTLDGLGHKIFVAKYKSKLPSDEKIKQAVKKLI
ncbi:conserved hypothetical protein [Candidatus Desulfarcum epimagneticum]|uniref:Cytoplasmic protein n=1 Tax=uncultured Desulfobacteraceae bacterium TaxID=218296 RepID=A0A484HE03_9BACT|nr:conserved hypothetical protein [uncultured Desulfobacteraceae bacterium]